MKGKTASCPQGEKEKLQPEHLKVLGDFFSILLKVDLRLKEQKKDEGQKSRNHPHST